MTPEDVNLEFYHTGKGPSPRKDRRSREDRGRSMNLRDRRMIAWDGEGMKLSGAKHPQHYVLFGCSADVENPLIISSDKEDLAFIEIVDYVCDIGERFPHAFHIGYFFKYDQNMIIKSLGWRHKMALYEKGSTQTKRDGVIYRVSWTPGKRIRLTRDRGSAGKSSVIIDDIAPFFAKAFIKACEELFPGEYPEDMEIVRAGKADRAEFAYDDMPIVLNYWQHEIIMLERLADRFRTILYDGGFMLREWYGPGALANLIIKTRGMRRHLERVQPPEVHEASKRAFFGGHVEQFQAGRARGPIYSLDIRSAYPNALSRAPSLGEGEWCHVSDPSRVSYFGVYRVRFKYPVNGWEYRPMPLPHRDNEGLISYPPVVEGWYWSPEVARLRSSRNAQILEGWEWIPATNERPWYFLKEMYDTRAKLKRMGNPVEKAFKLGPNSLYGKVAQRVGWDKENFLPPRSHCLPLAGWITSYTRAMIWDILAQVPATDLIAVETDGIYMMKDPRTLRHPPTIGNELGEWDMETYDQMMYFQNGIYLVQQNGEWKSPKTRGMDASAFTASLATNYLTTLTATDEWQPLVVPQKERFVGIGAAINRATAPRGINPFKMNALHCKWEPQKKEILPGKNGKRIHVQKACPACVAGYNAEMALHRLSIRSRAMTGMLESQPYDLPWEKATEPQWRKDDQLASEMILSD